MAGKNFYKLHPGLTKSGLYYLENNPGMSDYQSYDNKELRDFMIDFPIEPQFIQDKRNDIQNAQDEYMGMRNLLQTEPFPTYGEPRNAQENIKYRDKYSVPAKSEIKDPTGAYAQVRDRLDSENNANAYTAFMHGQNADDDKASNERFQELSAHADELKKRIMELKAEIAWQEKLRDHEMSNDPMWTVAKHKYIYDNDASHLENIMNRKQTDKQIAASDAKEKASQTKADKAAMDTALQLLTYDLDDFEDEVSKWNKTGGDDSKVKAARRAMLRSYQEVYKKAVEQGKTIEEVLGAEDAMKIHKYLKSDNAESGSEGGAPNPSASVPAGSNDPVKTRQDLKEQIQALRNQHKFADALKMLQDNADKFNTGANDPEFTTIQNEIAEEKRKWDKGAKAREAARQLKNALKDTEVTEYIIDRANKTAEEINKEKEKLRKKYPALVWKEKRMEGGRVIYAPEVPK